MVSFVHISVELALIVDYCDTHKDKQWQPYASAAAAAFAKDLLAFIPVAVVVKGDTSIDSERAQVLKALYTCHYEERKNRNAKPVEGTCRWFTEHPLFLRWFQNDPGILWVSADPGCGKSVLARYLVDVHLPTADAYTSRTVCYFFFNDDFDDQKTSKDAICALLRQLYNQKMSLLTTKALRRYREDGKKLFESFSDLWSIFLDACAAPDAGEVICILDALDECAQDDAKDLIRAICKQYQHPSRTKLKILITSRSYSYIHDAFWDLRNQLGTIHLSGEELAASGMISGEINLVIEHRLRDLKKRLDLTTQEFRTLHSWLTAGPQRTYLWIDLIFSHLQHMLNATSVKLEDLVERLPTTLDEVYEEILKRSTDKIAAKRILQALLAAYRPLTVNDIAILLSMDKSDVDESAFLAKVDSYERWRKKIRNICGLLVVVVHSRVYLLHQTARQFLLDTYEPQQPASHSITSIGQSPATDKCVFKWKASLKLQDGHAMMVESCIQYLLLVHKDCESYRCLEPCSGATFRTYCYTYWTSHYREHDAGIDASVTLSAERLCQELRSQTNRCHCRNLYFGPLQRQINFYYRGLSLGLAAVLELPGVLELELLSLNMDYYKIFRLTQIAIEANHIVAFRILLKQWPKWLSGRIWLVELVFGDFTPLHRAVEHENLQLVKLLLSRGANINTQDWSGRTPLHVAVQSVIEPRPHNHRQVNTGSIEVLVAASANCYLQDLRGWTAAAAFTMSICKEKEDSSAVRRVLDLFPIRQEGIDQLWQYDFWPRELDDRLVPVIYDTSSTLWAVTMLGGAAIAKRVQCIDALLRTGANPKICDNRGHGLLHCAVLGGGISTVEHVLEYVLSQGISIDEKSGQGHTPLMLATMIGAIEISTLLIRAGADVFQVDNIGMTLLMHVTICTNDQKKLLDLYLKTKVKLDATDRRGMTALMHAAESHQWPMVEQLLDVGADASISDSNGHTLCCLLEAYGPREFLTRLGRNGLSRCSRCNLLGPDRILSRYFLSREFRLNFMIRGAKLIIKIVTLWRKWPASKIIAIGVFSSVALVAIPLILLFGTITWVMMRLLDLVRTSERKRATQLWYNQRKSIHTGHY